MGENGRHLFINIMLKCLNSPGKYPTVTHRAVLSRERPLCPFVRLKFFSRNPASQTPGQFPSPACKIIFHAPVFFSFCGMLSQETFGQLWNKVHFIGFVWQWKSPEGVCTSSPSWPVKPSCGVEVCELRTTRHKAHPPTLPGAGWRRWDKSILMPTHHEARLMLRGAEEQWMDWMAYGLSVNQGENKRKM